MKKILRTIGVVTAIAVATGANAQIPDNGIWPAGVTFTDINSNTHDIDAYLDAGQSVIIDAFADWCGPCWSYHTGGYLENVYNSIGMGGTGEVIILSIEADPSVPESNITDAGTGYGDWSLGGTLPYPLINSDALAGIINLAYYPTLILICPDRTVTEVGQVSSSQWEAEVGNCGAPASFGNDPRILSTNTPTDVAVCGSSTGTTDIEVIIQNYSTSPISGAYDIEVSDGSTIVASTTATLNLAPYAVQTVNVGVVTLSSGSNNFTATITTANDDASNDDISIPVSLNPADVVNVDASLSINIALDIDAYPTEVGFALREGTPASNNPLTVWNSSNAGNSVAYQNDGSISNSSYSQNFTLNTTGCHYIVFYDDYGDGITYNYPNGKAEITGTNTLTIPGDWGDGTIVGIEFKSNVSVDEFSNLYYLSIYPNPAVNMTNVQMNLSDNSNVTIEVINTLGQIVYAENLGEVSGMQNVEINTADLEGGMYLVNIKVDNEVITERISVIK